MESPAHSGSGRPAVSLIVPVHNGDAQLRVCLEQIRRLDPPPDECIVVDDGSSDRSPSLARAFGCRVVSTASPRGPAVARNAGAREARGEILLFVDADVLPPLDAVARVRQAFSADLSLAAVIGSYDDAPSEPGFFSQFRNLLHHYVHQNSREEAGTFWSGCGAIRREVFLRYGGFCSCFSRPSIEDIELGTRLREAGERIRLMKELQAKHLKRWTFWSMVRTDIFDRALPWTRLILRQRRMPADLNLRWRHRFSVALWTLAVALAPIAFCRPVAALVAFASASLAAGLNADFYRFLAVRRGWWFALRAVPAHGVHFLCCAAGFGLGVCDYLLRPRATREATA
ncbi:MAG: glycosyltransferase [Bryobacteraceae bacterium]